jgi:hypothetical protein
VDVRALHFEEWRLEMEQEGFRPGEVGPKDELFELPGF